MLNVFNPVVTPVVSTDTQEGWTETIELMVALRPGKEVYIEWPSSEPMANVIAAIHQTERGTKGPWKVVFDPTDDGLLEVLVGGYRLHGMFVDDLKE